LAAGRGRSFSQRRNRATNGASTGRTAASGLGSGRCASEAGGRARAACIVAAIAIAAKPQSVPAASPVSATAIQSAAKPSGLDTYSRSSSQDAVPTRKPMPKKVVEETARSA